MTCAPNRGAAGNKLMLINHWVGYSPPDPGKAGSEVNAEGELTARIEQCIAERGVCPTWSPSTSPSGATWCSVVAAFNQNTQRSLDRDAPAGDRQATAATTPDGSPPPTDLGAPANPTASGVRGPDRHHIAHRRGPGDLLCRRVVRSFAVMTGWALADLAKPANAAGLPALTYGPVVDRAIAALRPSTPTELVQQLGPAAGAGGGRSGRPAPGRVRPVRDRRAWPTHWTSSSRGPNPDQALAEQRAVDLLDAKLGHDGTLALARTFDSQYPTVGAVFDLGDVSTEVANSSGYGCLVAS